MKKLLLTFLPLLTILTTSSSCLLFVGAAAGGGGYYWYNGRIDKNLNYSKDHVYKTAIEYLKSKGARVTLKDETEGKVEGKLDFKKTVTKTVDGKESQVEETETHVISFFVKDFKHKVPKDPNNPTENEKKQIEKEKDFKSSLSFKVTDGVNPIQDEAKQYFSEFEKML